MWYQRGRTSLNLAAENNHIEVLTTLLIAGADVDKADCVIAMSIGWVFTRWCIWSIYECYDEVRAGAIQYTGRQIKVT
jgi:hypothetical protein